jgi:tRNA/rRNA methyltransferase
MELATNPDSIGADDGVRPAQLRFVLVEPSHVGNIGSCARAIRAMGFTRLYVVRPRDPGFRTAPDAVALAAGAADVLARAQDCASLGEALQGVHLAYATTGYAREFAPEPVEIRAAARQAAGAMVGQDAQVAFVFGTERTGLSNADVQRCHHCCYIPADPQRASLNLAQAAQVVAYENRRELLARMRLPDRAAPRRDPTQPGERPEEDPATVEQTEAMFEHLAQGLAALGYLDPEQPKHLLARLRRLLLRAQPSATEVDILRGIASAMVLPRTLRAGRKTARPPG